nr:MAG TPA: hypothetical protein [Caudoviricetes sp.]
MFLDHLKSADYIKGDNNELFLKILLKKFLSRIAKIRNEGMEIIMQDPDIDPKDVNTVKKVLSAYISACLSNDYELISSQKELFGMPVYT